MFGLVWLNISSSLELPHPAPQRMEMICRQRMCQPQSSPTPPSNYCRQPVTATRGTCGWAVRPRRPDRIMPVSMVFLIRALESYIPSSVGLMHNAENMTSERCQTHSAIECKIYVDELEIAFIRKMNDFAFCTLTLYKGIVIAYGRLYTLAMCFTTIPLPHQA